MSDQNKSIWDKAGDAMMHPIEHVLGICDCPSSPPLKSLTDKRQADPSDKAPKNDDYYEDSDDDSSSSSGDPAEAEDEERPIDRYWRLISESVLRGYDLLDQFEALVEPGNLDGKAATIQFWYEFIDSMRDILDIHANAPTVRPDRIQKINDFNAMILDHVNSFQGYSDLKKYVSKGA